MDFTPSSCSASSFFVYEYILMLMIISSTCPPSCLIFSTQFSLTYRELTLYDGSPPLVRSFKELLVILASPFIQHKNIVKPGSVFLLLSRHFWSIKVSIDNQLVFRDHSYLLIQQVCFI